MSPLHDLLRRGFDLLLGPLDGILPGAGLWVISALSGVALLWAFRRSSNPAAIRAAKQRAQAELLAVRLYRDAPRTVLRAQASFLAALGRYLGHMLVPFAVLLVPFGLLAAQLDARYGARALHVGERAVVEVTGDGAAIESASLEASGVGVAIESGPVRIAERGEMSWRVLAKAPGVHAVTIVVGDVRIAKSVAVSTGDAPALARRAAAGLSSFFLAPAEDAIDDYAPVRRIEIRYEPLELGLFGWKTSWLVVFLIASATVALALRRRMGVEF